MVLVLLACGSVYLDIDKHKIIFMYQRRWILHTDLSAWERGARSAAAAAVFGLVCRPAGGCGAQVCMDKLFARSVGRRPFSLRLERPTLQLRCLNLEPRLLRAFSGCKVGR